MSTATETIKVTVELTAAELHALKRWFKMLGNYPDDWDAAQALTKIEKTLRKIKDPSK